MRDEVYPYIAFEEDIKSESLYLLVDKKDNIASAFSLIEDNDDSVKVKWKDKNSKALYINRFAVNVDYLNNGIGSLMIKHAIEVTKEKNYKYLRLFVVDINKPAINLYLKNGFNRVQGIREEVIENFVLYEYGFEMEV